MILLDLRIVGPMRLSIVVLLAIWSGAWGFSLAPTTSRQNRASILTFRCQGQDATQSRQYSIGRRALLTGIIAAGSASSAQAVELFGDSKVGWGETSKGGRIMWGGGFSNPLTVQSDMYNAEVVNGNQTPVIISFVKPKKWKVSTNTGISVQDYISADSGFVLVAPAPTGLNSVKDLDPKYALDKVFDIRGRYGAFGKVDSITVQKTKVEGSPNDFMYVDFKFTSLSPGSREIDRNGCVKIALVDGDLVMFVASSNSNRWNKVKADIAECVNSFSVVQAPKTQLRGSASDISGIGNLEALGVAGYDLLRFDSPIWSK